jgi:hypothetical protein
MLIKKIKSIGYGFWNLASYRRRLLFAVGLDRQTVHGQAPPATPIRGGSPGLAG